MFSVGVIEGRQGIHRYYTGVMSWGELEQLAIYPEDLSDDLDEEQEMQRSLAKKRITDLVDYLAEDDHFFSALTFVILPRDLETQVEETGELVFEPVGDSQFGGQYGILKFSGALRLFPADGQHRTRAGARALRTIRGMVSERVPVVLLPYRDTDQVRQLFSDLNLNAKPVNKTIGYAFDSRDPIAQLAKKVGAAIPLFAGRVNKRTNSLPRSSANVITLNALVEGTRSILEGLARRQRVSNVEEFAASGDSADEQLIRAWELIVGAFSQWVTVLEGRTSPGKLREDYVFPHGLGWLTLTDLAGRLMAAMGDQWPEVFLGVVRSVDWSRTSKQLDGLAVINGKISNTKSNVSATTDFLFELAEAFGHERGVGGKSSDRKAV